MPSDRRPGIGRIARRELQLQLRDGRLVLAAAALGAALAAAAVGGWVQYDRAESERRHFVAQAREQWLHQGARHPHRAAHFGAYVAKPELPLALFEPGLRPFAGQTLWLEAHDRPAYTNVPSEDDLTLGAGIGVASGSAVLQMLGGLLALVLGALAVVRERESGTLRQVLAQGVRPRTWIAGKFAGLAAALGIALAPAALLGMVVAVSASEPPARADVALRAGGLVAADALLLGTLLMLGLAISARSRSSRAALIAALSLWVIGFILAPRAAAALASRVAPTPTLAQYQAASAKLFDDGIDARGGYMAQLDRLRAETLSRYRVARVEDLPTGFSGIRMRHLDAWSTEIDDREYRALEAIYDRQGRIRLAVAAASPFIAARSVSQAMTGMDWAHYRDFLVAAEKYRRGFGAQMNALLQSGVRGDRWEMNGGDADWSTVRPFAYAMPDAGWALTRQAPFAGALIAWTAVAALVLALAARRLRP